MHFEHVVGTANHQAAIIRLQNFSQSQRSERDSARGEKSSTLAQQSRAVATATVPRDILSTTLLLQ